MTRLFPRTLLGRACLHLLGAGAAFAALFGAVLLVERATGCTFHGGLGSCRIEGVELFEPLSAMGLLAGFGLFLLGPMLALGGVLAGLACLILRRW